jgi:tRNA (guanine-N7-)-methyltransferase
MADLLPGLQVDLDNPLKQIGSRVWLEIGFGGGEHLANQAHLNRDVLFVGADTFVNGIAKLLSHIEDLKLDNIRIYDGDARNLLEALPSCSIERVFLLYPDPWPKTRHNRRRFVRPETVDQIHRVMKPAAQFLYCSDSVDYVVWTREIIEQQGRFTKIADGPTPFPNWTETRYESKARHQGRSTTFLAYLADKPNSSSGEMEN